MARSTFLVAFLGLVVLPLGATAFGWRFRTYYAPVVVNPAPCEVVFLPPCPPMVPVGPMIFDSHAGIPLNSTVGVPLAKNLPPQPQIQPAQFTAPAKSRESASPTPSDPAKVEPTLATPVAVTPEAIPTIPKTELPAKPAAPKPAEPIKKSVELPIIDLGPAATPASNPIPKPELPLVNAPAVEASPKPELPTNNAPAPAAKPELPPITLPPLTEDGEKLRKPAEKAPTIALPEITPGAIRSAEPATSRYQPDSAIRPNLKLIPVEGRRPANGIYTIGVFNYTDQSVELRIDNQFISLLPRHSVSFAVGDTFVYRVGVGADETITIPADSGGYEVVIR